MSGANPYSLGTGQMGPPSTVNVQLMSELVAASNNAVVALSALAQLLGAATGITGFSKPPLLPSYTVANLPAVTLANVGSIAFATNGRNTGEGAAAGTGCTLQVQNKAGTATWCAIWSGVAVTV
jgi:hypothetical protein